MSARRIGNAGKKTIGELVRIMQGFGRPFGHRLNQAIWAYVANYPSEGNPVTDARVPLADQIEFRPFGLAEVDPIPWVNRPTFQQVVQVTTRRAP